MHPTLCGITALVMWSTIIGIMRSVTEAFGVLGGTALVYSIGSAALFLRSGPVPLKAMPKSYLLGAGAVFVLYEICFSQGLGLAGSREQALEVGMLNYLWPCFMVVFAMWINNERMRWWVWPGTALSLLGICFCLASGQDISPASLAAGVMESPLPYLCGLAAGIGWALYSNLSARLGKGYNAVPVFFAVIGLMLWTVFLLKGQTLHFPGWLAVGEILFMGVLFGASYSLWEVGVHGGNFMLLAVLSYFTPAGSMLFAAVWLRTMPAPGFWAGVVLVIAGSILCWHARLAAARTVVKPDQTMAG